MALADAARATQPDAAAIEIVSTDAEEPIVVLDLVNDVIDVAITYILKNLSTLLATLIGVFGVWLTLKIGKSTNLQNSNAMKQEAIRAAKITVSELQQTVVDELKVAHADGKLTPDEIATLVSY